MKCCIMAERMADAGQMQAGNLHQISQLTSFQVKVPQPPSTAGSKQVHCASLVLSS